MLEKLTKYLMRIGIKDEHDAMSIAIDVVMDERTKGYEFRKAKLLAYNYFERVEKPQLEIFESLDAPSEEDLTLYDAMPYDNFNERKTALQVTQRQLINKLADGSDERTTLIVQTFLDSDKPTVTNVAKRLGLDHKQVSRSLAKLSKGYSEDKFGYLGDYFREGTADLIA